MDTDKDRFFWREVFAEWVSSPFFAIDSDLCASVSICGLKPLQDPRYGSGFRRFLLFPGALRCLDDQAFLDGTCGHPHVTHLSVHQELNPLEIGKETALGNSGDMRADAAAFLRFATAPNDAALDWALAG